MRRFAIVLRVRAIGNLPLVAGKGDSGPPPAHLNARSGEHSRAVRWRDSTASRVAPDRLNREQTVVLADVGTHRQKGRGVQ